MKGFKKSDELRICEEKARLWKTLAIIGWLYFTLVVLLLIVGIAKEVIDVF